MTPHLNYLVQMVQMRGHNIWFQLEGTLSLNYHQLSNLELCDKVGNRPVNMSIDQTSGHYWLKPVISGRLVVDWSIEITLVSSKVFSISHPLFTGPY